MLTKHIGCFQWFARMLGIETGYEEYIATEVYSLLIPPFLWKPKILEMLTHPVIIAMRDIELDLFHYRDVYKFTLP